MYNLRMRSLTYGGSSSNPHSNLPFLWGACQQLGFIWVTEEFYGLKNNFSWNNVNFIFIACMCLYRFSQRVCYAYLIGFLFCCCCCCCHRREVETIKSWRKLSYKVPSFLCSHFHVKFHISTAISYFLLHWISHTANTIQNITPSQKYSDPSPFFPSATTSVFFSLPTSICHKKYDYFSLTK